jgi:phage shock protein PspC (stress-responsive transcriptional regulator)
MNRVISINLNGNAYQLEEEGFASLDVYLKDARRKLSGNPDLEEILADLEQAIADKCNRFLRSGKSVILSNEVNQIIEEMGPVRDPQDESGEPGTDTDSSTGSSEDAKGKSTGYGASSYGPRKLYRLKDDKMVEGVCSGIAAYFGVDPTIVRIPFVLLLILSHGIAAIAYLIMAVVIPVAKTPEEHAAAHGAPFDARDVLERAKNKFESYQGKADKAHRQKAHPEYWKHKDPKKSGGGLSTILAYIAFIVGVVLVLKFLYWPISPVFLNRFDLQIYNPWISLIVLFVLIYILGKLIKNLSTSGKGDDSLLAGILKFCLVFLVVMFVIRMFPVLMRLFMELFSFIQHLFFPFHWWW